MAQIFHRSMNVVAPASIVGGGGFAVVLVLAGIGLSRSPYNTKVGVAKEQPVPFSHEHHAVELGIDCRYCHTAVEKSASAGIPPTHTCMSCHSQIWTNSPLLEPVRASYVQQEPLKWNRLHSVPDFVYFNHSIHINRGINCNNCHGPIQKEMIAYKGKPFWMAWCLNCHRNPENAVGKREDVFGLYWKYQTYQLSDEEIERLRDELKRSPTPALKAELKAAEQDRLTPEQATLAEGEEYSRNSDELKAGAARMEQYKVKKEQLTDCYTCHR
jgi:hypothetical protein